MLVSSRLIGVRASCLPLSGDPREKAAVAVVTTHVTLLQFAIVMRSLTSRNGHWPNRAK